MNREQRRALERKTGIPLSSMSQHSESNEADDLPPVLYSYNEYMPGGSTRRATETESTTKNISDDESKYSSNDTYPGLARELITGKLHLDSRSLLIVLIVASFVFVSLLFWSDNQASKLDCIKGLCWFLAKAGFYLGIIALGVIVLLLVRRKIGHDTDVSTD